MIPSYGLDQNSKLKIHKRAKVSVFDNYDDNGYDIKNDNDNDNDNDITYIHHL